jgi:hypothetical protein
MDETQDTNAGAPRATVRPFNTGDLVAWTLAGSTESGRGKVIGLEDDAHVIVAVESMAGEPNPGYHAVIYCAETWLRRR